MNRRVLITGDYKSLAYGDRVPSRGVSVKGRVLYEDGQRLGRTVSTRARAAFEYLIEPDGCSLRIYYTPEAN